MNVIPVKLRNRPIPLEPIQLPVNFAYSRIGNDVECMDADVNQIEDIISAQDIDDELESIL
jgi:hypothetical protein